jgi:hypothetical protein
MARQERKYHYIYKITCNVTNRYYIGMHSTDDLNDGYFGSGKRLWYSINYHGKENHVKEILEFLPTRQLLKEREKEMVNKELLGDVLCMNLKEGGDGGFINEEHMRKAQNIGRTNMILKIKTDSEYRKIFQDIGANNFKEAHKAGKMLKSKRFTNKQHSDETKQLMCEQRKGTGTSHANSQYGTCWITKDGINKKVKKEEINSFINNGWVKGRK